MQTLFNRYNHGSSDRHKASRFFLVLSVVFIGSLTTVSAAALSLLVRSPAEDNVSTEMVPVSATTIGAEKERTDFIFDESPSKDNKLQETIEEWVTAHSDNEWSIVVQGLNGDNLSASVSADMQYETASIYKLLMSYPLLQLVPLQDLESRTLELEDKTEKSFAECLDLMLRVSDNPCGEAAARFITYKKADEMLHEQGYLKTNLYRKKFMVTTAGDTVSFLADLYEGRLLSPAEREIILSSLKEQQVYYGIPSGCSECTVMNKTGDWNDVRHDAGIVQYSTGAYVIVIFSEGGSYAQFADLTSLVHQHVISR